MEEVQQRMKGSKQRPAAEYGRGPLRGATLKVK